MRSRRGKGIGTQGCIRVVGMSNTAKSLWEREVSQGAFMVVCRVPLGEQRDVRNLLARQREGKKMASVMKVIVGLEGSRCCHDERPRPQGPQGKSCVAYM